jgi:hypothetical protein
MRGKMKSSIVKKVAVSLARKEGKKSQVKMGDCREIIGIISDMLYEDIKANPFGFIGSDSIYCALVKNGRRRAR